MRITGVKEKRTYEVVGYRTKEEFDDRNHEMIADELTYKRDALKLGKEGLSEFRIIKVQSNDREWIEILKNTTKVIFKKKEGDVNGEIIAIFPEECTIINDIDTCLSYRHKVQHGVFNADLISKLSPAIPEEYADLKKELEGIGYDLEVRKNNIPAFFEVRRKNFKINFPEG